MVSIACATPATPLGFIMAVAARDWDAATEGRGQLTNFNRSTKSTLQGWDRKSNRAIVTGN
jgi:hypothetical protein